MYELSNVVTVVTISGWDGCILGGGCVESSTTPAIVTAPPPTPLLLVLSSSSSLLFSDDLKLTRTMILPLGNDSNFIIIVIFVCWYY